VGKSTLLNLLTNAKSRVANYPFTTLEPHLGAYYEIILADIPGLIEGASDNKGLGIKFLKHIERTKTLFHFISCESTDTIKDYQIIRKELKAYSSELLKKKEYVFLSKTDIVSQKDVDRRLTLFENEGIEAIPISQLNDKSITKVKEILNEIKKNKIAGEKE